ncbi:helix-turn-helix domain-containing protein [Pseudomonas sp. SK]|uniref:helix-turn-helix domain-containing protein n=1 Tax=Pseudomonas sp. SK TaxID=2729423 RepID=UPI0014639CAB|nr:helix-turn-helix domain-containing protein [Pseudomonas sp. SK]QJQ21415.1 helix-turn-helix domain-containing protein [Pseudomonas sp. SK]
MSMELMVKAMKTKVGNPLRKLVLIKLADNASDQGECWPSYQHIADQCEISKRSVMNHISTLCGAGLLRKEIRKGGPKGNSSNVYYLTLSGAADSLGVVQEIHQGSAASSPPSAADSLGGSAGAAPRTSHSFESVKEPVTEPVATQAEAVVAEGIVVPFTAQQPRCEIPADMPGPKDQSCKTFKAWANYAMAYRKRYHAWPVWNAKAGGQVGQLISRLGIDVAHHVAAYFLTINDARLINGCHNLGDLLAKAEAYHTQWVTNRQMNATIARQQEQTQANINAAQEAADAIRNRQRGKRNAFL